MSNPKRTRKEIREAIKKIKIKMESKICALCDKEFKGCPCYIQTADDGAKVHNICLDKYNAILKLKQEESEQKKG